MIYVTGDTHGDYTCFKTESFPEQKKMTKEDYVIICGDFGIWNTSKEQKYWLDWLDKKSFTTLFLDGNHENYDLLNSYPIEYWNGGKVHFIRPSIIHLMRGQLYELEEKRIFTMGGASSHDVSDGILDPADPHYKEQKKRLIKQGRYMYRVNHLSWWKEELPSEDEYAEARKNLESCNWEVDYIFTHCAPSSVADLVGSGMYQKDTLTDFHEEVSRQCKFDYWFFGHYHGNRIIKNKYMLLYEQIVEIPRK